MSKWIEHPLIYPEKIEARLYQQVLAADVLRKGNTMIVAPTALGKTIVASLVAAERLKNHPDSKVLVVAPSKPLAVQHEESFRQFLKAATTLLTGAVNPKEREDRWEDAQVILATPQTIESDLIAGRYTLKDVSLLVFDECHRGTGSYSYVFLATNYNNHAKNPLILGLTASPGGDEEKINSVCQNLFIKEVMVKNEDDADVKPYFNPIEVDWVRVELTKEQKDIKTHLEASLKGRLRGLKKMGVIRSVSQVSKGDILRARSRVQNRISRTAHPPPECLIAISVLTAVFSTLHSLELLETQGIRNLQGYFQRLGKKTTKAAKGLLNDNEFKMAVYLTKKANDEGLEHPKMKKLLKILKKELRGDQQVIVFSQYRDTVNEIHKKCQESGIKSVKFFGQASREKEKGLSQKKQKEIIKDFRRGTYQVLVSTSVAEEGIDIPSVDLVVLYEPVPSEIRMIQRRGRTGRKSKGRMIILITKGTRDESYYYSSQYKERRMKKQLSQNYQHQQVEASLDQVKLVSGEEKPVVYVDHREAKSGVARELHHLGVKVVTASLSVADYQVGQEVAVERKSTKDFVGSVIDKRLHKQAKDLVESFQRPVMILEGDDLYRGGLHPNAIRGALASLAVDFGLPIIPTRSPEDTAAMIQRLAIREKEKGPREVQIRTERKPLTSEEQQLFIVESLPQVGPVTARKLLEEFDTVEKVIQASEAELQIVEGIGKKIARDIREVLESEYKSKIKIDYRKKEPLLEK
ncbi:MAG: Hef nuclease [Methanobacteriales archaeon Met13]